MSPVDVEEVSQVEAAGATPKEEKKVEKKSLISRLEEEGEVAADYLEALMDIVDLDGDIDIDVENERA
ncbi:MAG: single-stranded DNA-binding protein, partial [Actinomycetes bacterium]